MDLTRADNADPLIMDLTRADNAEPMDIDRGHQTKVMDPELELADARREQQMATYPNATQPFKNLPDELLLKIYGYVSKPEDGSAINEHNHDELSSELFTQATKTSSRLGRIAKEAFYKTNIFEIDVQRKWDQIMWLPPPEYRHWVRVVEMYQHLLIEKDYNTTGKVIECFYPFDEDKDIAKHISSIFDRLEYVKINIILENYLSTKELKDLEEWLTKNAIKVKTKDLEVEVVSHVHIDEWSEFDGLAEPEATEGADKLRKTVEEMIVGGLFLKE